MDPSTMDCSAVLNLHLPMLVSPEACAAARATLRAAEVGAKGARYAGVMTALAGLAAFGAGGLTVVGVWLKHRLDRQVAERDRRQQLKTEVMLQAADAFAMGMAGLGRMGDPATTTPAVLARFDTLVEKASRLSLVAESSTISAALLTNREIVELYAKADGRNEVVRGLFRQAEANEAAAEQAQSKANELSSAVSGGRPLHLASISQFQRLHAERDQHLRARASLLQGAADLRAKAAAAILDNARTILTELEEITPNAISSTIAIRREVGLPINEDELRATLQDGFNSSLAFAGRVMPKPAK